MDTTSRSAHRSAPTGADELSEAARWLLRPWTVQDVCAWLGCTDRWLRTLRRDPDESFPAPLRGPTLRWWPADVLAWSGVSLDEALEVARKLNSLAAADGGAE